MKQNIVYKIYVGHKCTYIDYTQNDLTDTLRLHFFGENNLQHIDLSMVSKIEYAIVPTHADAIVQKYYLINKEKPLFNKFERSRDDLSPNVILPELRFVEYYNPIIDKWKEMLKTDNYKFN